MDGIFVGQVAALGSPLTAPADRAAADAWLRQFRVSDEAWTTSLSLLKHTSAARLDVALQAAQVLAWKCRNQGAQLGATAWPTLVQDLVATLHQLDDQQQTGALITACCVTLAAVAVAVPAWEQPLSLLGHLQPAQQLLFLRVLPQEAGDGLRAAVLRPADDPLATLSQRVRAWCPAATEALHELLERAKTSGQRNEESAALVAFGGWVARGCLDVMSREAAGYFVAAAAEQLLDAAAAETGYNVLGEVLEHGNREDSCAEFLCQVGLTLARLVLQGRQMPAPARQFLGLYCAAPENASLVGRADSDGATLRQALTAVLDGARISLGSHGVELDAGVAENVLGALESVFEAAAAERRLPGSRRRGTASAERAFFFDSGVEAQFAADTLSCLLRVLQPMPGAFVPGPSGTSDGAASNWGLPKDMDDDAFDHGVPEDLRQWASATIGLAGESLGAHRFLTLLCDAVQAARQQGSPAAEQTIETALYMLGISDKDPVEFYGLDDSSTGPNSSKPCLQGILDLLQAGITAVHDLAGAGVLRLQLLLVTATLAESLLPCLASQDSRLYIQVAGQLAAVAVQTLEMCAGPGGPCAGLDRGSDGGSRHDTRGCRLEDAAAKALSVLVTTAAAQPETPVYQLVDVLHRALAVSRTNERAAEVLAVAAVRLLHAVGGCRKNLRRGLASTLDDKDTPDSGWLPGLMHMVLAAGPAGASAAGLDASRATLRRTRAMLHELDLQTASQEEESVSVEFVDIVGLERDVCAMKRQLVSQLAQDVLTWWTTAAGELANFAKRPAVNIDGNVMELACQCLASCLSTDVSACRPYYSQLLNWAAACLAQPGGAPAARVLTAALEASRGGPSGVEYSSNDTAGAELRQACMATLATLFRNPAFACLTPQGFDGNQCRDGGETDSRLDATAAQAAESSQHRPLATETVAAVASVLLQALRTLRTEPGPAGAELAVAGVQCAAQCAESRVPEVSARGLDLLASALLPLETEDGRGPCLHALREHGALLACVLATSFTAHPLSTRLPKLARILESVAFMAALLSLETGIATAGERQLALLGLWRERGLAQAVARGGVSPTGAAALMAAWDWKPFAACAAHKAAVLLLPELDTAEPAARLASSRGMQRVVRGIAEAMRRG